jgi:hypothetical protein
MAVLTQTENKKEEAHETDYLFDFYSFVFGGVFHRNGNGSRYYQTGRALQFNRRDVFY